MNILICKDYQAVSQAAAQIICRQLQEKPASVLGLATGSTPIGTYRVLAEKYAKGQVDFSQATAFNLDEYYPMAHSHDQSYYYFMRENLFSHVNLPEERRHIPNGEAADPEAECRAYEESIKAAGGIDLQILGLGLNGHIGFNEPDDHLIPETHVVTLTESTRQANSRFFAGMDEVPDRALTTGIAAIMQAKKILLLVNGAAKAEALYNTVYGKVMPQFPASFLRLHGDVTVICDEEAGAKL